MIFSFLWFYTFLLLAVDIYNVHGYDDNNDDNNDTDDARCIAISWMEFGWQQSEISREY